MARTRRDPPTTGALRSAAVLPDAGRATAAAAAGRSAAWSAGSPRSFAASPIPPDAAQSEQRFTSWSPTCVGAILPRPSRDANVAEDSSSRRLNHLDKLPMIPQRTEASPDPANNP